MISRAGRIWVPTTSLNCFVLLISVSLTLFAPQQPIKNIFMAICFIVLASLSSCKRIYNNFSLHLSWALSRLMASMHALTPNLFTDSDCTSFVGYGNLFSSLVKKPSLRLGRPTCEQKTNIKCNQKQFYSMRGKLCEGSRRDNGKKIWKMIFAPKLIVWWT